MYNNAKTTPSLFNKLIRNVLLSGLGLSLLFLLTGCQETVVLNPKGMIAAAEKDIIIISVVLMLLVVVPVIFLVNYFAWRYRDRGDQHKAAYKPNWGYSLTLEIICWVIPCIIIGTLSVITWISAHKLDPYHPLNMDGKKPLIIQAISLQWKWLFIYPEQNIATVNYVQIPVGVPVQFQISAEGPMNSIQIPQLGGQIYAMAGMQTKLNLMAAETGVYQGISTQYSGFGFASMFFKARASTPEEFNQWVKTVKRSPDKITLETYKQLVKPSYNDSVKYFSSVNKKIFDWVVMKSMMPMATPETKMTTTSNQESH